MAFHFGKKLNNILLFDFAQTNKYFNGTSNVLDLSIKQYNNNGTCSGYYGATNLGGVGLSYNSTNGTLDFATTNKINKKSVYLPEKFKFVGRVPYTVIMWFNRSQIPSTINAFEGLVSYQYFSDYYPGYGGIFQKVDSQIAVVNFRASDDYINNAASIIFNENGVLPFSLNQWYMIAFGYDGNIIYISLYDTNGSRIDKSTPSTVEIVDNGYAPYLGLRYNDWLTSTNIGYVSIYDNWIDYGAITGIYNQTKSQYGY